MRKNEVAVSWAVYQIASGMKIEGHNVVCEQGEWETLNREQPGMCKLIRSGITNEGEAEQLARGTSGDGRKTAFLKR